MGFFVFGETPLYPLKLHLTGGVIGGVTPKQRPA